MSKEKLYGLRDQLSKFLYDPTPEQAAWRKKMWDEGRFDESMDITKQLEARLEEVEKQIEAFEAAEPELGEKIVANTLLNLPLGKQLKGTGLGSLLGLAEEELGAAESQRLKGIEQELNQLNSIYQQEGRGMEEMEALKQEKEGLMSLLGDTPTTGEDPIIEDIKKGLYDAGRFWQAGIDEDSSLYEALDQYKNLDSKGQAQVKDMLREDMFERLGLEDARADERFFSDSGAFDAELVDQHLNKELAGEYPKIFEKMGEAGPPSPPSGPPSPPSGGDGNGGPTREDVLKYINTLSLNEKLEAYLPGASYSTGEGSHEILYEYEDLFDWDKDLVDWENIPDDYRSDPVDKEYPENALVRAFLEKHQIQEKFETDLVKDFTYRGKSQPYFEDVDLNKIRVRVPRQGTDYGSGAKYSQKTFTNPTYGELKEWFAGLEKGHLGIEKPRSYQAGGLIMNYGDYGRSYK